MCFVTLLCCNHFGLVTREHKVVIQTRFQPVLTVILTVKSLLVLTGEKEKKVSLVVLLLLYTSFYADIIGSEFKCRQSPEYSLMGSWWAVKLMDKDTTCKFIIEKPRCTVAYKQMLICWESILIIN